MYMSATELGKAYGLTGQEMNRLLLKQGFLIGEPGDYDPTIKAMPYVVAKDFHRGTGGYSFYNIYGTTLKFDESIKEALDITQDIISEVRSEVEAARFAQKMERAAARAQANENFLAKQAAEKAAREAAELAELEAAELEEKLKKAGKIGLAIIGGVVVVYGVYKITPKIKKWWDKHKQNKEADKECELERNFL